MAILTEVFVVILSQSNPNAMILPPLGHDWSFPHCSYSLFIIRPTNTKLQPPAVSVFNWLEESQQDSKVVSWWWKASCSGTVHENMSEGFRRRIAKRWTFIQCTSFHSDALCSICPLLWHGFCHHYITSSKSSHYLGSLMRVGSCVSWPEWGSVCSPTASIVNVGPTDKRPASGRVFDVQSMVWTHQSLVVGTTVRRPQDKM
jgi:hypothetical protein